MTPGAVIFDIDGVLVDSFDAHRESWEALARETGVAFTDDDFRRTFGRTSADILRELWPPADHTPQRIEALDARKEGAYRDIISGDFPAMHRAEWFVRALHDAGIALGAGSSGPPENVHLVLETLGVRELFSAIITGKHVTRGKPDPQVFQLASQHLGVPPERCVVVEDAPAGIEAALRAEMQGVGFVSTGRTRSELEDAGAVRVLEGFDEAGLGDVLGLL